MCLCVYRSVELPLEGVDRCNSLFAKVGVTSKVKPPPISFRSEEEYREDRLRSSGFKMFKLEVARGFAI